MDVRIVGPDTLAAVSGALSAAIALGFGFGFMVHSVSYLTTCFVHFVNDWR